MLKYIYALFFLILLVGFSACEQSREKLIIGEWYLVRMYVEPSEKHLISDAELELANTSLKEDPKLFTLTFFKDNTVNAFNGFSENNTKTIRNYKWSNDGDYLTFSPDKSPIHNQVLHLTNDSLVMKIEDKTHIIFVFHRKS